MSSQTWSPKRKAIDRECSSKCQKTSETPCQSEPPWQLTLAVPEPQLVVPTPIIKLKDEYVEPEYQELVRLTLAPPPLEESRPYPSLLQLMPPSSSSTCSLQPPLESLSHQFPLPPGFPALPSSQPSTQSGILTVQPPALPALHQCPQCLFQRELRQQSPPTERKQKPPAEEKQEPPAEQKQKPPSELEQEQPVEQKHEPPEEQKQKPPSEPEQEQPAEQKQEAPEEQKQKPPSEPEQEQPAEQKQEAPEEQNQNPPSEPEQEPPAEDQARGRRPRNSKKPGWTATIEPPYPWATSSRGKVLSMEELSSKNITKIRGNVSCKECKKQFEIEYDLQSKFSEVVSFITENLEDMNDRAPSMWLKPEDLDCEYCNKTKCVQPLPPRRKRETNWLFLFLGQLIGYCNLTHLKYLFKHNDHHRTAGKDHLVYFAYTILHSQLDPNSEAAELYKEAAALSPKHMSEVSVSYAPSSKGAIQKVNY
ncbi:hypothetical protein K1719_002471 [Acacia pycnantha]|nr:hypothetical protein K1719_002471 [Acacia pycnantha]